MIINENIRNIEDITIPQAKHTFTFAPIYINELNLIDGATYTISLNCDSIGDKQEKFLFNLYDVGTIKKLELFGVFGKRNHMTFKYEEGKTFKINLYTGVGGLEKNSGAKFYNFKLEEGDKDTPYIPNENSIETAKRQYFIGGGYFKEVYPIS